MTVANQQHLSRHFLSSDAFKVRWVPFAQPAPLEVSGQTQAHKLVAIGSYNQDVEQHQLSILDVQVILGLDGSVRRPQLQTLASWEHTGRVTNLKVCSLGDGEVILVTGSSSGDVSRLQLLTPTAPGAQPEEVQLRGSDVNGPVLKPWLLKCHRGPVSGVDVFPDTVEVLTVGLDGTISINNATSSQPTAPWYRGGKAVSFSDCRWSSSSTFITAGTMGGLQVWDKRDAGKCSAQSPQAWGMNGCSSWDASKSFHSINSVCVHPSRPFLAASGTSSGAVAVWDLRFTSTPTVWAVPGDAGGEVAEAHFDRNEVVGLMEAEMQLLWCTQGGALATTSGTKDGSGVNGHASADGMYVNGMSHQAGPGRCNVMYQEPCASLRSFDVDLVTGQDIVAVTDQECLIYIRRPPAF